MNVCINPSLYNIIAKNQAILFILVLLVWLSLSFGTKYSRLDQVKFVKDFTWSILEYFVAFVNLIIMQGHCLQKSVTRVCAYVSV